MTIHLQPKLYGHADPCNPAMVNFCRALKQEADMAFALLEVHRAAKQNQPSDISKAESQFWSGLSSYVECACGPPFFVKIMEGE